MRELPVEVLKSIPASPYFLLRVRPRVPLAPPLDRTRGVAEWITERVIGLRIFAPGLKNYHLLPEGSRAPYYYFFMGEVTSPVSQIRIYDSGEVFYSAPGYTPGQPGLVYPEMLLAYFEDFLDFCQDLYRFRGYSGEVSIEIALLNANGLPRRLSQRALWRPTPPHDYTIAEDLEFGQNIATPTELDSRHLLPTLNRFFRAAGIPREYDDSPLPS